MMFQKWQLRSKENRCAPTAFLRTPETLRNAALQLSSEVEANIDGRMIHHQV